MRLAADPAVPAAGPRHRPLLTLRLLQGTAGSDEKNIVFNAKCVHLALLRLLNSSQLPRITFEVYYRDPDSFYCMGEGAGWCCFVFYDDGICECEFVNELIFLLFFCDEPVNSELIRGLSGKEGLFFPFSVSKILNNEQANLRCIGVLTAQNEFKLSYNF